MLKENVKRLKKEHPQLLRILTEIQCDDGWCDLVSEVLIKLEAACGTGLTILQIKEKLGRLVVLSDVDASCTQIQQLAYWQITNSYWQISSTVCEETGSDGGKLYRAIDGGRIKTLCPTAAVLLGYVEVPESDKVLYYPFTESKKTLDNYPTAV